MQSYDGVSAARMDRAALSGFAVELAATVILPAAGAGVRLGAPAGPVPETSPAPAWATDLGKARERPPPAAAVLPD